MRCARRLAPSTSAASNPQTSRTSATSLSTNARPCGGPANHQILVLAFQHPRKQAAVEEDLGQRDVSRHDEIAELAGALATAARERRAGRAGPAREQQLRGRIGEELAVAVAAKDRVEGGLDVAPAPPRGPDVRGDVVFRPVEGEALRVIHCVARARGAARGAVPRDRPHVRRSCRHVARATTSHLRPGLCEGAGSGRAWPPRPGRRARRARVRWTWPIAPRPPGGSVRVRRRPARRGAARRGGVR